MTTTSVAEGHDYRVELDAPRVVLRLLGRDGRTWLDLRPTYLVDTTSAVDETTDRPDVSVSQDGPDVIIRVESRSSVWDRRWSEIRCRPDGLTLRGGVVGRGRIRHVHLLADRRPQLGFLPSGSAVQSAVSPNPDHPSRIVKHAGESAVIGVVGAGAEPGVGRWLFTPAPWCVALSREPAADAWTPPAGEWATLGVAAPAQEQNWTEMHYLAGSTGLHLQLDYQGHTQVSGAWELPGLEILFGAADPYAAIAAYCRRVAPSIGGAVISADSDGAVPRWWLQPLFCGWGAQQAVAGRRGTDGTTECTEANYDTFLARLASAGIEPGTVVVDDKWAGEYAHCTPDTTRWPDLRRWVSDRHAEGRRVLLWWKAWDPEGAPADGCVRTADGSAVAIDPDSAAGQDVVRQAMQSMLSADGLDADGLKIDFTASTPNGESLLSAGPHWGASLLHELLALVHTTAKQIKPDALIITHTPNPAFRDVGDVLRLNDAVWMDAIDPTVDVVHQMTHRANVAAAAWPGRPIDTDGWFMPDPESWRRYTRAQTGLGIPALYYAGEFDGGNGPMTEADLALVADTWRSYRQRFDLPTPSTSSPRTPVKGSNG